MKKIKTLLLHKTSTNHVIHNETNVFKREKKKHTHTHTHIDKDLFFLYKIESWN